MKGILFKPESIQAIIEGRKTQTRRLGGLKEINQEPDKWICIGKDYEEGFEDYFVFRATPEIRLAKPRYHIGETVYIKEVWGEVGRIDGDVTIHKLTDRKGTIHDIIYPNENPDFEWRDDDGDIAYRKDGSARSYWHSPMMMPEKYARHFIVIEQVRAERLQEISLEDLQAEGLSWKDRFGIDFEWGLVKYVLTNDFMELWNTINLKYPWESNPWVNPYTFRLKEGK